MPFDVLASAVIGATALQRSGLLPQFSGSVSYHQPAENSYRPASASSSQASLPVPTYQAPAPVYQALTQTASDAFFGFLPSRAPQYVRYNGFAADETEQHEYYPDGSLRSTTIHRRIAGPSLEVWY
jgi:hypothetical protein